MKSKKDIVIKCWNCRKKFTISTSRLNPPTRIYKGGEPSTRVHYLIFRDRLNVLKNIEYAIIKR